MSTALITGANRGIGQEVARALASEGWHVLSGVRNPKSAPSQTQAEIIDMADPESIEALAERLRAQNQRLDALVNNAGVNSGGARNIWAVNVLGPLRLTRALQSLLVPNARVVMVSSGLGRLSAQPRSLVERLSNPKLSLRDLEQLAEEATGGYGEMGGSGAPRSVQQGAASILWGVRLSPGGPSGGVFQDGKAIE